MISLVSILLASALSDADIREVTVTAPPQKRLPLLGVDQAGLDAFHPVDLAAAVNLLPSAALRVNSRGEAQVFIRGASERETAIYWRGLPLLVPYDNRIDLGFLPNGGTTAISLVTGPQAFIHGPRSAAASIFLDSQIDQSGATMRYGTGDMRSLGLGADFGETDLSLSYTGRATLPLAAPLPFSQDNTKGRTNTDADIASIALTSDHKIRSYSLDFSILASVGEKGIAPQSDRNPDQIRTRFWRYPDHRYLLAGLDISKEDNRSSLSLSLWTQLFSQSIAAYTGSDYQSIESTEFNNNLSFGFNGLYARIINAFTLSGHLDFRHTHHKGRDENSTGTILRDDQFTETSFSPSLSAEFLHSELLTLSASAGLDIIQQDDAANRVSNTSFHAQFWRLSVGYELPDIRFIFTTGEKGRAPTLREQYGVALGRFVPNPLLRVERNWSNEAAILIDKSTFQLSLTGFARRIEGALEQISLGGDGPQAQLQRVNTAGYSVIGLEAVLKAQLTANLALFSSLTYTDAKTFEPRAEPMATNNRFVPETPPWLARTSLTYRSQAGLTFQVDAAFRDDSYSQDAAGQFTLVKGGLQLGGTAGVPIRIQGQKVEAFLRVDNIFDVEITPQAGLPLPGRSIQTGLKILF